MYSESAMESPRETPLKLFVELEPRTLAFWSSVRAALHPVGLSDTADLGLWHDVFVGQNLPWRRFFHSAVLHAGGIALIWMLSLAWIRQQGLLPRSVFDRSSLVTFSPEEYLPPLDTGASRQVLPQKGDPEHAKQPIILVPPEADNRTQTIVTPPDIRLNREVPLPNMVAMGTPVPAIPLDAIRAPKIRLTAPETAVVPPAPELDSVRHPVIPNTPTSDVIAPPPEVTPRQLRGFAGPEAAVVEPPPELPRSARVEAGPMNIGPSDVIAPAPQLPVAAQRSLAVRRAGTIGDHSMEPVAPPPSVSGVGRGNAAGRLIALGIHPVAATGPIPVPEGNRRGTFAATPQGKPGAPGTPDIAKSTSGSEGSGGGGDGGDAGFKGHRNGSLPSGLHVGAADANSVAPVERPGAKGSHGDGDEDGRVMASVAAPLSRSDVRPASPVSANKVTDVDRRVFGTKRFYSMIANMPNLNSASGSWVIRFAELKANKQPGELIAPDAIQKSDPGYPIELMRANVQGTVTLYAVIHSDGSVGDIRVLSSPDERLEPFATSALKRWKFRPAIKDGQPVALEAVVMIPFRAKRNSF